jgi:DNA gyrase subunit A
MARKKQPTPVMEETQELYDQNIELMDAGDYTKQQITTYGVNISVARGCPMLWDGLIPVVRKFLWYMYHDKKLLPDKRSQKALEFLPATAKYHPHGDQSITTAFENVTKSWENSVMYIEMDGNEGSVAGDDAAAPRYLDAKLSQYSFKCFFEEFDESIIEMQPNYLRSDIEPVVFPAKYPNFLLNLTTGIAWGNAFVKSPFNLIEAFTLTQDLITNPEMTGVYLFPDSPRGYDIIDDGIIRDVCETGSGTVRIRAKLTYHPEGHYILCNGFPERTTMDSIIRAIGEREHRAPLGIKDISDKSDLENTEFWIILRKGTDPDYVIHELYKDNKIGLCSYAQILLNYADRTRMLSDTGSLPLKDAILKWIDWRVDIKHRTIAKKLRKLREEKHRLEALVQLKSQKKLDGVFNIIKTSETDEEIIERLMDTFGFTSYQADLISNMKAKHQKKSSIAEYVKQYEEIDGKIKETEELLTSKDSIKQIIWDELEEGKKLFGKPRSCRIIKPESTESPIFHYRLVVTKRFVKRLPINGVGTGFIEPDDDAVQYFHDISSKDYIHIGTEKGFWCYVPVESIPSCDPSSKGTAITELVNSDVGNAVVAVKTSVSSIKEHPDRYRLYCFTRKGLIKATPLSDFTITRRQTGAITLNEGDKVCFMGVISDNDNERLVYTKNGLGIILKLSNVPSTGRLTKGQRVMKIANEDEVLGVCASRGVKEVLVVTKKGFAKIVELDDAFIATKKRQTMLTLTRFHDTDELFKIHPIGKDFYNCKLVFHMQSGEKTEIDTTSIKVASRNSKCFKVAPVRRGDSIIRLKLM